MSKKTGNSRKASSATKPPKVYRSPTSSEARVSLKTEFQKPQSQLNEKRVSEEVAHLETKEKEQKYLDIVQTIVVAIGKDQRVLEVNKEGCEILGYPKEEIIGENWFQNFIPERMRNTVQSIFHKTMTGEFKSADYFENPVLTKEGEERIIHWRNSFLTQEGEIIGALASGVDITDQKRAELQVFGKSRTLEKISKAKILQEVLDTLANEVETQLDLKCSILLLDQESKRLYQGSARSLPKAYMEAINGIPIGPNIGSCGTAAYLKTMVMVEDIATDPLWEDYKHLALSHGLKACWSAPIFDSKGSILGTFGLYYSLPRKPKLEEVELIQSASYLAGLAIEQEQSKDKLKESDRRLSTLVGNLPGMVYRCQKDKDWTMDYVSDGCKNLTGYRPQDLIHNHNVSFGQDLIHPEDKEKVWHVIHDAWEKQEPFQVSYRIRTFYGEEKWVWEQGCRVNSPSGNLDALEGYITDITKQKQAQQNFEKSQKELRNLSQRLQMIREEEKKHMAREIHDELGTSLTALRMDLFLLESELPEGLTSLQERTKVMGELIDTTIKSIQSICMELRPQMLDVLGLPEAIKWQCKKYEKSSGIKCKVVITKKKVNLDPDRSITLFRILQESLTNVSRHAEATHVTIKLGIRKNHFVLTIEDNGRGINKEKLSDPNSLGLIGMRERVLIFGGNIKFEGCMGKGTTLIAEVPCT